ncbi:myb-related protein 3R-1-like protein [Tritrichomonas foetus]|uniref:Myb-related protein 3R-1-like protein n=1 Tax=Tritrichomonas foetus TaxID=1144522 RepID=A0A1J4L1L5_9EUKA|nr:myb-related protein 3R-1-like protein [Tritrichomonas foetus]|eukprot:OHT15860.1 myb-related protein 3R-1-like protein [Tritrichomonas foetus]
MSKLNQPQGKSTVGSRGCNGIMFGDSNHWNTSSSQKIKAMKQSLKKDIPNEEKDTKEPHYRKVMWNDEEDNRLRLMVSKFGNDNWNRVSKLMPGRNAKQCRERWAGILSPELRREAWTSQEDELLIKLHEQYGNKWALLSTFLPGRSRIGLRNRWNLHKRHQLKNPSIYGNSKDRNINSTSNSEQCETQHLDNSFFPNTDNIKENVKEVNNNNNMNINTNVIQNLHIYQNIDGNTILRNMNFPDESDDTEISSPSVSSDDSYRIIKKKEQSESSTITGENEKNDLRGVNVFLNAFSKSQWDELNAFFPCQDSSTFWLDSETSWI